MELTKEQIQYIENRLIKDGVKYWDIRIEMLDHIVSDVENTLNTDTLFKESVQNAMVKLGWKENFNGSNFERVIQEKQKAFAKKYRKSFWKYFKKSLIKTSSILWASSFIVIFYFISLHKVFLKSTLFSFLGVMVVFLFYFLAKYKVYKSIQLNNALNQASFSLVLACFFTNVPKMFDIDLFQLPFLTTILFSFVIIQSFLGIRFFLKEYQKINTTYQKLISSCN
uniref:hypothetical protein n=1 Tax=uncultured Tenacibaculum sp. TaxID=174713 RepID=UPI0026040D6C|nr:hypothetical protein [uncultured Tenacibaculum sp.]